VSHEITVKGEIDRRHNTVCRFTAGRTIYIGTASFSSKEEARGMALAEKLFEIEGVAKVSLIGRLVVITRESDRDWAEISPQVEAVISAYLVSGLALTADEVQDRMQLVGRSTRDKIQYLLDRRINPGVAVHAGFVELLEVRDNIAYVRMGGGCQGCGAADFTLRRGIEAIIQREVPEIRQILDVTDHAAGMNPYYRPAP